LHPAVIALRNVFSIELWNTWLCGTSRKSAKNAFARIASPPAVLTATALSEPGFNGGLIAVRVVLLTNVAGIKTPPIETSAPGTKFVPVMVTRTPPFDVPDVGLIDVIVGGGRTAAPAYTAC